MPSIPSRCAWAAQHELLKTYHDREWGVPVHEDRLLFELLNLEGAQAGLSWLTVLKKRARYQQVFDHFDASRIAQYDAAKKCALLDDEGIIRNRLKIDAVIGNAKALLALQRECGSFDQYLWQFVGGKALIDGLNNGGVEISVRLSKALKKRASALSARVFAMPLCKRPAWSTITLRTAFVPGSLLKHSDSRRRFTQA